MDKVALQSLASDLKRITLSIQRNSNASASRFNLEAEKRLNESKSDSLDPSLQKILGKVDEVLKKENDLKKAEDCLMYATLIQNRSFER